MNNTTSLNETALNATNGTAWNISDITDVQGLFAKGQETMSNFLISWNMVPEDFYFRMLVTLVGVIAICWLIIKGSNLMSGALKWVLLAVLVVIVLIALGII